ncbi:MAG: DUF1015 domain-containing protein [Magnetococcales bacterium]|nr:DUF1015 domain-containing protein [Magnetococcales bacterium]
MDNASLIQPFPGLRPLPELVARVSAPPYDVLNRDEAARLAAGNPYSILHVSKAEIDLDPAISPHDDRVYRQAGQRLAEMKAQGLLVADPAPCLYLYRLIQGDHAQVGVVAATAVEAYLSDRVRKHELTRPDKEDDRTRLADTLSANAGPVFLTYRRSAAIDDLVQQQILRAPEYDFTAEDGVRHTLWVIRERAVLEQLVGHFEALSRVYVADGHHRSAAAARVCRLRRQVAGRYTGAEPFNRFLAVLFPDNQMRILEYNRVVLDLNGLDETTFLERVSQRFRVTPTDGPLRPERPRVFGLLLGRRWFRLEIDPRWVDETNPIARLDVSLLQDHLLAPILGIGDPRRDGRIDFVGGIRGTDGLEQRVHSGSMAAAFCLHPTVLADLMAVADADAVMPPKSTWFEPKLRDGLVIQEI